MLQDSSGGVWQGERRGGLFQEVTMMQPDGCNCSMTFILGRGAMVFPPTLLGLFWILTLEPITCNTTVFHRVVPRATGGGGSGFNSEMLTGKELKSSIMGKSILWLLIPTPVPVTQDDRMAIFHFVVFSIFICVRSPLEAEQMDISGHYMSFSPSRCLCRRSVETL